MSPEEAEQTMIALADFFEGIGDTRAIDLRDLVNLGTSVGAAFLTGSRCYGTPAVDSDIDLVALVSRDDLSVLCHEADTETHSSAGGEVDGASMRFGKLNLIAFTDPGEYIAWKNATAELYSRKPVTRDEAVTEIKKHLMAEAK